MRRVLLPYDFSPQAQRALMLVLNGIPFGAETQLDVLHVIDNRLYERVLSTHAAPTENAVKSYLASEIERAAPLSRKLVENPKLIIVRGHPASEILARANDYGAVVLGGQGHGGIGEAFLGTTAMRVVREATNSVYVAKKTSAATNLLRVMCAVDDDGDSRHALKEARSLCRVSGAELSLLRVVPVPYRGVPYPPYSAYPAHPDIVAEQERLVSFEVDALNERVAQHHYIRFASAGFANDIVHQAVLERADVLVVGARESGIGKRLLGSVSEGVVARAVSDVYVVR